MTRKAALVAICLFFSCAQFSSAVIINPGPQFRGLLTSGNTVNQTDLTSSFNVSTTWHYYDFAAVAGQTGTVTVQGVGNTPLNLAAIGVWDGNTDNDTNLYSQINLQTSTPLTNIAPVLGNSPLSVANLPALSTKTYRLAVSNSLFSTVAQEYDITLNLSAPPNPGPGPGPSPGPGGIVPEPGTFVLGLVAFLGLAVLVRRRK